MRMSKLFCQTLRENPSEADTVSHQLLLRGSFLIGLATGTFTWLPLGMRVKRRVEDLLRQELARLGAQEIETPTVRPAEL